MAISLINSQNVGDNGTLQLGGASYVTTAVVGGTTYVFVTGKGNGDNGVSVFSLNTDGTLTNVDNVADNNTTNIRGAFALTTAVVGGTTYLFVEGVDDSGISVFSVAADGHLTNVENVADNATLRLSLTTDVETMVVGGTTYLFSGGVNDNGVSVFAVGANGSLTNVDNVIDDNTSKIQGPQGLATATVDGNAYVFVTGFHDNGVGVYSVAADGHLTNVFNVSDSGPMELGGPVDAITAVVGGTTYLFVSGFGDDGLTVFSVAANGALTNVFNVPDDGTLKLDNPVGLSTTVLNGTTYLFVAGADDDGLSVFAVGANGALTNVTNVSDDATLLLDRVIGVTTVTMNGQTYVIAASNNDSGVSVFKLVDDTVININHEPTLTAAGNDPTFTEGSAAADLYSAPLASTADSDSGQSFTSLTLTVTNVTDGASEILSFLGHDLALTDGNSVAGVTVSVVGTTATVTFPGAANAAALQALIDGLAYRNASENPTEADRVMTITNLVDSGGTAGNGDDTAALNIVSTVHVAAANDAAIIDGETAGDVTEAGSVNNGTPTATGNLDSTDVDNPNDAWSVVAPGAGTIGGFGTYAVTADGQWTYTLDNANAAVQALNGAATLVDTFNVVTADGTTQLVTITIHAQNDKATITGTAAGTVIEASGVANGTPTATGDLLSTDVDNTNDAWQAVAAGAATTQGYGTFALTANGVWTYTLDNNNAAVQALNAASTPLTDTFTVLTQDGTAQIVTVTINGVNDAATITGTAAGNVTEAGSVNNGAPTATGSLDSTDVDNPNDAWSVVAPGAGTIGGFGTYAVTADGQWTYTLDNANAAVQALNGAATLVDTFNVVTADGTTQLVTVTIHAQNDAATITGDAAGAVAASGGNEIDTGDLNAADPDNAADAWQAVAAGAATANGFGTYQLTAAGVWTYTLDNTNAAVQALNAASAPLTDTFTVLTQDGTSKLVTVTINGVNDAATISGTAAGNVTEAGSVNNGTPTATGNLDSTDVDNPNDAWQAVAAGAATTHGFGTYAVTADGVWTYTLDNANAAVQALNGAATLVDTFNVVTTDGTAQLVTVTINGVNDAATITGTAAGNVTEAGSVNNGAPTATGNLDSTDVDNPDDAWSVVAPGTGTIGGFGTYAVTADGQWTYALDNSNAAVQALNGIATLTDTFNVMTADGTTQLVTITIHAQNDAATITGDAAGAVASGGIQTDTGDLNAADPDNAADAWQAVAAGAATTHGYGTFALTADGVWTYTLDNNNAAVQALNAASAPLIDTFTVLTQDGTAQLVTVTINGVNDAATITGIAAGNVTEASSANPGAPTTTGNLDSADVDNPNDAWSVVAPGTGTIGGFGTYAVTADGQWTYALDNSNAAVQALNGIATMTDTFNVVTVDGTTQLVTITIHAQNDKATITGTAAGTVVEASGVADGIPTATGDLLSTDVDNTNDAWQAVAAGAATTHGYGTFALTADGVWTYTLDNTNAAVHALTATDTLTDTFTVWTQDDTAQVVTVTIHGQNDAPVIDLPVNANSDVLWRHINGAVSEWHMGAGQIIDNLGVEQASPTYHFQDVGDFNADGHNDVLWRHDSGQVVLWTMDAHQIVSNQAVATIGNDWHNEGAADFGGDGRSDVLWRNDSGQVALWTMDGAQISGNQSVATVGNDWHVQGLLDAGGDGKSDVLLRNDSGQVVLWTMNGAQITGNQSVANLGLDWNIVGTGDFGGDGKDDVLLRNDSGQVVIWQMNGAQIVSNQSVATPGNDWHVQDVGDYNSDGRSDVLWRNDSGQVVMWEMNGSQIVANHEVSSHGQPAKIGLEWTALSHHYDLL